MLPDRVSNPGPLTYESGVLPIALRGPAGNGSCLDKMQTLSRQYEYYGNLSAGRGWSGGAMVPGKLPVPGRPSIWIQ